MGSKVLTEWRKTNLGDIARKDGYGMVDGPFGSNIPASDYTLTGIPVIRGSNLSLGDYKFRDDEFTFISRETADRLARSLCRPDDIIFTKKGTLGQTGIVPKNHLYDEFLISSNQMKLSVNTNIADPLYVYYYVSSPASREKIVRDAEATGVPKTNLTYLRTFPILLPPLAEQRAIARVLGSLDDKIELNRKLNATLEETARAIFQSWFIDFDPVRAKAAGRTPAGLDAATAALFPDRFDEIDGRRVPRGWDVGVLKDLLEFAVGGDWGVEQRNSVNTIGAYCIRGTDIPFLQEGGFGKMPFRYIKPTSLGKRKLQRGDLVIEVSGGSPTQSTGRPVLILEKLLERLKNPLICSNFCRMLRLVDISYANFAYLWLRRIYTDGMFLQYENGTTGIKNLAFTLFCQHYHLVIPPKSILRSFNIIIDDILLGKQENASQSDTLAELRDALLPRLLSGELRVRDAERILEE